MTNGNNHDLTSSTSGDSPQSTRSLSEDDLDYLDSYIRVILKIYPVLILILGCCGNLLSFCVLLRAAMRRYSTFCYLACLALVDIGVILTFTINFICLYHFDYDIQRVPFLCKLFAFCIYFLPQYSSWILVAVSIDRVISVKYIRLSKKWSKPKNSVLVTFLLGTFLVLLNGHFFLYENASLLQKNETSIDHQQDSYGILHNKSIVDDYFPPNAFGSPSVSSLFGQTSAGVHMNDKYIIERFDSSISYGSITAMPSEYNHAETTIQTPPNTFSKSKKKRLSFQEINRIHCSLEYSEQAKLFYQIWTVIDFAMNVFIPFTAMIACTIIIILKLISSSNRAGPTSARGSRRRRNISVMLITINLVFISLTAPIVTFLLAEVYLQEEQDDLRKFIYLTIKVFSIILMNLNHSVNIVIYSVTAKEFRSEMVNFLRAVFYCIIGGPPNDTESNFLNDDGSWISRFRIFRQNLFKCCRMKLRFSSTNTTDSSGAHHRAAGTHGNNTRSPNSKKQAKTIQLNRNGKKRCSLPKTSETLTHACTQRLVVHAQTEAVSSVCERDDASFHAMSVSTED